MKTSNIPDFPKIRINNYISKLSDKIRVLLEKDTIATFADDSTLENISSKLKMLKSTLRKYIKNKKYPIFFLKELNIRTNKDIFGLIEDNTPTYFSK